MYVQYLPVASPFVLDTVTAISVDNASLSISTISTRSVTSLTEYAAFSKLTVLTTTNNDTHNKDNYKKKEKILYIIDTVVDHTGIIYTYVMGQYSSQN